MISDEELVVFTKELQKLLDEYYKCDNTEIKKQIYDDILFLIEIIKPQLLNKSHKINSYS